MVNRTRIFVFLAATAVFAQTSRPVPPPGIEVSAADRKALEAGLTRLAAKIAKLQPSPLVNDVRIFHDAVRYALTYNEFLKPDEIVKARDHLMQGEARADALAKGEAPWARQTGLIVRGYESKIDGSVQPYGLVIPENWTPNVPHKWRLDAWFHGRSEVLTEVNFLWDRQRLPERFTPNDTIVLHLYGRYCNANKMAGEVDLFEALADVEKKYRIDRNRISVRGFSMGGAAAWQFATHFAGRWAAAAPGAGFAETAVFLDVFQKEKVNPPWWEKKLWKMYDATEYAANLYNLPVVAYSGEKDSQKQAADIMAEYMAKEGLTMTHIIGPGMGHAYDPGSIVEINRRMDAIVAKGREEYPATIRFTTYTLRYNRMKWVVVDAMEKHWEKARVDAQVTGMHGIELRTANVAALTLDFASGASPLAPGEAKIVVDGQQVTVPGPESDRSWHAQLKKVAGKWAAGAPADELRKRHGLQGPVDDAFWNRFIMVKPTGKSSNAAVAAWADGEMNHAIKEWRRQFRGEAIVKTDAEITDDDIAASNLVLWGDPQSNKVLARIADKLPVQWTAAAVMVGAQSFPADKNAAILIYPNPLNPKKYVVLNSGFTFREYDYLNNARQISKIGDYAVVDTTTPPDDRYPGKIVLGGFFGERWELLANHGQ